MAAQIATATTTTAATKAAAETSAAAAPTAETTSPDKAATSRPFQRLDEKRTGRTRKNLTPNETPVGRDKIQFNKNDKTRKIDQMS